MDFKPIKPKRIYLEIVNQIKHAIEIGDLKPGDKLPGEIELARQFNASRSSLREALSALEIIGLIEGRRGNGNYIKQTVHSDAFNEILNSLSSQVGPFEILEARKAIEPSIVRLAAEKRIDTYIEKMESLLQKMPQALQENRWSEVNTEFHLLVAKAADNPVLYSTMEYIVETMRSFVMWRHIESKALATDLSAEEYIYYQDHVKLVKAIKNGDADEAVRIMLHHIEVTEEDFLHKG